MKQWASSLKLPRTVWLLGLISLINDSASDMLYPLIPLYLTSILMAGPKALGIIEGVAEASVSLAKLASGIMIDRTHRSRPWIVAGYGVAGAARPLIALIGSWPMLLVLRLADRLGKGIRTAPRDALLAASVEPGRRGLVFGFHRAMDNLGAVIGPLLAFCLLARHVPLKSLFFWAIVPALICFLLAMSIKDATPPAASSRISWQLSSLPLPFRRYLVVVALFALGNSSNMFLLLRAHDLGLSVTQVPLLWGTVSLVAALFSTPLAALSDHVGRKQMLIAGYMAYGLIYLLLAWVHQAGTVLYLLFAGFGLFLAATEGVEKAMVADMTSSRSQGTTFGWFNLVAGLGLLPASLLFGWLYQQVSPPAALIFSGGCAVLAAVLLWQWIPPQNTWQGRVESFGTPAIK